MLSKDDSLAVICAGMDVALGRRYQIAMGYDHGKASLKLAHFADSRLNLEEQASTISEALFKTGCKYLMRYLGEENASKWIVPSVHPAIPGAPHIDTKTFPIDLPALAIQAGREFPLQALQASGLLVAKASLGDSSAAQQYETGLRSIIDPIVLNESPIDGYLQRGLFVLKAVRYPPRNDDVMLGILNAIGGRTTNALVESQDQDLWKAYQKLVTEVGLQ